MSVLKKVSEHLFDYSITEQMFVVNSFLKKIEQMFDKKFFLWYISGREGMVKGMPRVKKEGIEEQILEFIEGFVKENGYSPSVREIGSAVGFKSPSTVHLYLKKLEGDGKLSQDSSKTRSIKVYATEERHDLSTDHMVIPVLGNVAAGVPITAEENIMDLYAMPTCFSGKGEVFMLKVRGDSMINVGILDGDYVIVSKQSVARNYEIIVAMIDGEATVKRYFNEGNRIRLQPENDTMDPIYSDRVEVVGKVIGVFRTTVI